MRLLIALLLLACHAAPRPVAAPRALPAPTGPLPVGRTSVVWSDAARNRDVRIDVWYPAATADAPPAPYLADLGAIEQTIGTPAVKKAVRKAYDTIERRADQSYALAAPPPAPGRHHVIVFSHGFAESSQFYAVLLEDLASRGYVVLGVEHPGDAFASVANGRVIPFDDAAWQQAKATSDGAVAYQIAQVVIRSADLRFVIDRLRTQPLPLGIDVERTRVGVFGHSLGGMAAAGVCAAEPVVACANLDADYEGLPWLRDASPPTRPFLFFATPHSIYESPTLPVPTDDELAKRKTTREAYNAEARKYQAAQDAAMAGLAIGHRIAVETPDFTHGSFMDLGLLGPGVADAERGLALANLAFSRRYLRAFFDTYLTDKRDPALDEPWRDPRVRIERFTR
jgi:predicted dienelactone hydrolase